MELNKIQSSGSWGKAADDLNQNFYKVDKAVEQVKNATTRNKGYFSTDAALKSAFKSASLGDIAYVGSEYPYQTWAWNGSEWEKKNENGGHEYVNLGDYYTKENTDQKLSETSEEISVLRTETDAKLSELGQKANDLENCINANRYGYNVTVNGLKGSIHTIETAVKDVPSKFRMLGQKITFRSENGDWATYHNESLSLDNYENVNDWVQEVGISSVTGDVNISNNPDYEDLTEAKDGTIKFADKEYNEESFSGLGRVYLRKNIVDGVNLLTQDMVSKTNTIYIIQYDYDLQGETINVPEGCIFDFQGGSFDNGVVKGNKTYIKSSLKQIFGLALQLKGSYNLTEVYPEWWGAKGDGYNDDTEAIQSAIDFATSTATLVTLINSNYKITRTLIIGSHTHISGGQDYAPSVLSPVITQYGECDIIVINNDRFTPNHYIFDIHLSDIKLTHNIKKKYYGISLDEKALNLEGSTLMNTTFKYLRITECKAGIAVLWNSKGGFLYNYWDNLYISDSNIGILFESYVNPDTESRYSSYVNLNTFDNCHFSNLTNCGIFVRIASTFTTNSICNGSFEAIGANGIDTEIYKDYGCSAIAVLSSSSGVNTIENNYIEHIYPNTTTDRTDRVYTEDTYTNFLCACIVNLNSGLRVIGNHFYLFSVGVNTGCNYTSLYTKDNNIRNLKTYHTNDYFLKIYNDSFSTNPLYNQFVFEDAVMSPSDSTLTKYYVFEKNSIYNTINCNIVDKTNLEDTPRLNYFVNNRTLDKIKLYVNNDGYGDGLYEDTPSNIVSLANNVLYRNAKSTEFLINEETSVTNSSYYFNSDTVKISPTGDSGILNINEFTSVFASKTLIFENITINLNSYSAIKTDLNTNTVLFRNCKINITSASRVLLSINNGALKNILFDSCEFINEDSHEFTLSASNFWNCIVNFNNTTIPEWMIVNDKFHISKSFSNLSYTGMTIYKNEDRDRYVMRSNNNNTFYIEQLSHGTFENKPDYARTGERYYCTDKKSPEGDSNGIVIYKHSDGNWRDSLGRKIDDNYYYSTTGTYENRPTNPPKGTAYFCTDKQTVEGASNGIMIYYKGNNVWVDALGRVVE